MPAGRPASACPSRRTCTSTTPALLLCPRSTSARFARGAQRQRLMLSATLVLRFTLIKNTVMNWIAPYGAQRFIAIWSARNVDVFARWMC